MNKINADFKYLISLWVLLILAIIPSYAHYGHLLIDCGREAYYPTQILLGKVLYKDIFNIYGPFSYMFNALLFKIFSINLNVLYIAGCACAFSITSLIYLISKNFLPKILSFSIALFTIAIGVSSTHVFNFVFPYSYGILYGLSAFLFSFWALVKYQKTPSKTIFLYLSCFFAGLCVTSKYEFFPYIFVVLYGILKVKRLNFKQYYYSIFSILFIPILCFGTLFLQGLRVSDLIETFEILKKMSQTQTLKYFYLRQGIYFSIPLILQGTLNTLITLIGSFCFLFSFKLKNKFFTTALIILSLIILSIFIGPLSFSTIPILIVALAIWDFKNLKTNLPLQLLVLSSVLFSIKVFWGLIIANYGIFFLSFLLIAMIALISDKFKDRIITGKPIGILIIILALIISYKNFQTHKDYMIKTQRGKIYTEEYLYSATQSLIDYINKNTKTTDTVVILPEAPMINFLTARPTDNYYTSLIPLYVETFGEDNIINHFKKTEPEYIIFDNWNTKDYYLEYICKDYANGLCNFVATNYTQERVIDKDFRYIIFKKRK